MKSEKNSKVKLKACNQVLQDHATWIERMGREQYAYYAVKMLNNPAELSVIVNILDDN